MYEAWLAVLWSEAPVTMLSIICVAAAVHQELVAWRLQAE
jgi:hypothetical protein